MKDDSSKKANIFKAWGFDYNVYRPILNFARAEGIPVVALNVEHGIVSKVFHSGHQPIRLTRKRRLLRSSTFPTRFTKSGSGSFQEHKTEKEERFDYFYQAQVLWDEAMAESIADFLKREPAYQIVVLAGSGHLTHGSGIPSRVARQTKVDSAIILSGADLEIGEADYLLSPKPVSYTPAPKLMVFLVEESGKVAIQSFPEGSISEKAGMKAGDVIRSIDRVPIRSFDDVRIELLFHKKDDRVKVRVLRKEPSGEEKEMEFELTLNTNSPSSVYLPGTHVSGCLRPYRMLP